MAKVEMYSTMWCPYCARARALLELKGAEFTEIDLMEQPGRRDEMIRRAGGRTTVPQIFIDGEPIGGCDDMVALDRAGKLDLKLGVATSAARLRQPASSSRPAPTPSPICARSRS